jgi:hypothetical protein
MRSFLALAATVLGVLGGVVGALAAVSAILVNWPPGVGNPSPSGVGFGLVAFVLAALAGAGGMLTRSRPALASLMLVLGSVLGFIAINLSSINTWYALALPLCLTAAVFALAAARSSTTVAVLRIIVLAVTGLVAMAGVFFGGYLAGAVLALVLVVAIILQFISPASAT